MKSINNQSKVINIENSNDQDYKKKIENEFKNVECILTGKNLGYATANNLGLKKTKTKFALILNPDTKISENTLEQFIETVKKYPDFAIMGVEEANKENSNSEISRDIVFSTNSVKGHAMLLNLSEFKKTGFFDEKFFIYLEEIDLCNRLIRNGKKIFVNSEININHQGGSSHEPSINFEMELSRNWHWMWSRFYYQKKTKGYFASLIKFIPIFLIVFIKTVFYTLILNKKKSSIYFCRLSGVISSMIGLRSWYRPKV